MLNTLLVSSCYYIRKKRNHRKKSVWRCGVDEAEDHCRVSDGGRILFKLDPNSEDEELNETAKEIAIGSGYQFDDDHFEIYVDVDRKNVAQAAMKLAQLQVAISYLG